MYEDVAGRRLYTAESFCLAASVYVVGLRGGIAGLSSRSARGGIVLELIVLFGTCTDVEDFLGLGGGGDLDGDASACPENAFRTSFEACRSIMGFGGGGGGDE